MKEKTKSEKILIFGVIGIIAVVLIIAMTAGNSKNNNQQEIGEEENQKNTLDVINNEQQENLEFAQTSDNGSKINTSEKLKEQKVIEGLNINNIELKETNQVSQILASVENTTEETKGGFGIIVDVVDKNNNTLVSLEGYVDKVKPGETLQLNILGTADFANAYDFVISKV